MSDKKNLEHLGDGGFRHLVKQVGLKKAVESTERLLREGKVKVKGHGSIAEVKPR